MFLKISQNSQENTCARFFIKKEALVQVLFCETLLYRTPLVAASERIKMTEACNFIETEAQARVLSCKFCKILRTSFLQKISARLLLFIPLVFFQGVQKETNVMK